MKSLDIKLVQIETITDMSFMLYNCESLLTLPDISNLNTSCVTDMSYMFFNCKSLLMFADNFKMGCFKCSIYGFYVLWP